MKAVEKINQELNLENNLIELLKKDLKTKDTVLVAVATTIKGTSFIYVKEYFSKTSGLVNNYSLQLGFSNENAIMNDFEIIKNSKEIVFENLKDKYSIIEIEKAFNELYTSLEKRSSSEEIKEKLRLENDSTINRSDAQNDAYIHLAKGVKMNKETRKIYIIGLEIKKTFVEKRVDVKPTNSKTNTIIKKEITKFLKFRQNKIRNFIFDENEISIQGLKINQ